jgi:hypothetical protein
LSSNLVKDSPEAAKGPSKKLLVVGVAHQHQWLTSTTPSGLELSQRRLFTSEIRRLTTAFKPTIIFDEIPDTDNSDLLAALPFKPIPVDIPSAGKLQRGFNIERSIHFLCPYIDALRERYWRHRIYMEAKSLPEVRALMFVGAKHLRPDAFKTLAFPVLMERAGYEVDSIDLYQGTQWDHSWVENWRHPHTPVNWEHGSQCCVRSGSYHKNNYHCERKKYWK